MRRPWHLKIPMCGINVPVCCTSLVIFIWRQVLKRAQEDLRGRPFHMDSDFVDLLCRRLVQGHNTAGTFASPELAAACGVLRSSQVTQAVLAALLQLRRHVVAQGGKALDAEELACMARELSTPLLQMRAKLRNAHRVAAFRAARQPAGSGTRPTRRSERKPPELVPLASQATSCDGSRAPGTEGAKGPDDTPRRVLPAQRPAESPWQAAERTVSARKDDKARAEQADPHEAAIPGPVSQHRPADGPVSPASDDAHPVLAGTQGDRAPRATVRSAAHQDLTDAGVQPSKRKRAASRRHGEHDVLNAHWDFARRVAPLHMPAGEVVAKRCVASQPDKGSQSAVTGIFDHEGEDLVVPVDMVWWGLVARQSDPGTSSVTVAASDSVIRPIRAKAQSTRAGAKPRRRGKRQVPRLSSSIVCIH